MDKIEELEQAIAALESQRAVLGDAVVETALASMRQQLAGLKAEAQPPEHQRKLLTVLFTDIVGSTATSQGRDPEEILEVMDGSLKQLAQPVAEYGGRVTRFMGDGFIALFGHPVSHEDDAERAIRAGLAMLALARQIAARLAAERQWQGFNIRIGVNTGLVATGGFSEAEDTIMGLTVNLAARLESAAPPGGLLISEYTQRQVSGLFELREVEAVSAKGFPEPVRAYLVLGARKSFFRRQSLAGEVPLVGRRAELEQLINVWQAVQQGSRARIVTLYGAAGIGKSGLLYELMRWLGEGAGGMRILQSRATQLTQITPYGLLHDLVDDRFGILDSDPADTTCEKLVRGFSRYLGAEAEMKSIFIGTMLGFEFSTCRLPYIAQQDAHELHQRALHYLEEYVTNMLANAPVAVLLEDVHYADRASLETIASLLEACAYLPLLVVCLRRPDTRPDHPVWDWSHSLSRVAPEKIDLLGLPDEAVRQLVGELLQAVDDLPAAFYDEVVRSSEGNPFYIQELVKIMVEGGVLYRASAASPWQVDLARLGDPQIPTTLTALIQARLESLPPAEKSALQQAAVAGLIFWDSLLERMQNWGEALGGLLGSLAQRELILPRSASQFQGAQEYIFKSDLVREVVYESVLLRKRQAYHLAAGGWLEQVTHQAGREGEYAAVIGAHYQGAGELARAAGWYLRAAQRASAQGAPREARSIYDRTLRLLPETDLETRWQALAGRSEALGILGETQARRTDDAALVALAEQLQDDDHLADAYFHRGFYASTLGNERQAQEDYQQALLAARRAGNQEVELTVLSLQALSLVRSGEAESANQVIQKTLQLSQGFEDGLIKTRALTNLSVCYSDTGDLAKAIQLIEQLAEITNRLDWRLGRLVNLNNLGYNYILLGNYPAGLEALQTALQLADEMGARHESAFTRMNLGLAYLFNQDCEQAKSFLEGAIRELDLINDQYGLAAGINYLGLVYETKADWSAAGECFSQAHRLFEENGMPAFSLDSLAGMARCQHALGNDRQALAYAGQVWANLRQQGGSGMEFPSKAYLTCAHILPLGEGGDIQALVIQRGYAELMARAEKISDPQQRAAFLEKVADNAAVVSERENLPSGGK